jgi:hypothetical protein
MQYINLGDQDTLASHPRMHALDSRIPLMIRHVQTYFFCHITTEFNNSRQKHDGIIQSRPIQLKQREGWQRKDPSNESRRSALSSRLGLVYSDCIQQLQPPS